MDNFEEDIYNLHMAFIVEFKGKKPVVSPRAYLAPNSVLVGEVEVGDFASIWYNAVVRGDINHVKIGNHSNIQDNCVIHVTPELYPVEIGSYVTVGHGAVIHGAVIMDMVLVGMGAVLLDGVKVGFGSIIGAGAVIPPGTEIPDRSLVVGVPGKVIRQVSDAEFEMIRKNALEYLEMAVESFGSEP